MSVEVKRRRGSSSEIAIATPALGEIVVNTDDYSLVVGDGSTVGGIPTNAKIDAKLSGSTTPNELGAVDAPDPTGRGAFAPAFITSLQAERRNGVTLRNILGKTYNSTNDGAATLNTYLAELAGNNIAIIDPDNIKVLCLEPIRIVDGMVMDLGYYTRFSRGYSDSSEDNSALFSRADWAVNTSNMRISKGILTAETGETGKMMTFYGDDNHLTQTQMLNYQGGQGMVFGGDHNRLTLLRAITTVDSFGDGAFRMVGGDDMKAFGLYADSYDDCLQYVPITGSTNERFNLSISNSQYIGCYGKSRGARSMIAAIAGPQDEFAMTGTIRNVGFTSCHGGGVLRSINVENTEGDGNVDRQIDNINFTDVHIDGSREDQTNTQSFQVLGGFDGAIGKVSITNSTFKNSPRALGLSVSYAKEVLLGNVYMSGETSCVSTTTAVGVIKVRDSELALVDNGGGNTADNVLQLTNSDISIKDTKVVGVASTFAGLRLNTSGKKATLENVEYIKAATATTTVGTSHATGSSTIANNVTGDVDDLIFGGGDYTTLRGSAELVAFAGVQTTNLGALQNAAQDVNTLNKVAGVTIAYDSSNSVMYWATGSAPTSPWEKFLDGTQVTPV